MWITRGIWVFMVSMFCVQVGGWGIKVISVWISVDKQMFRWFFFHIFILIYVVDIIIVYT